MSWSRLAAVSPPTTVMDWGSHSSSFDDSLAETGVYADGRTWASNSNTYLRGCRNIAFKNALKSAGWDVLKSSDTTAVKIAEDCWIGRLNAEWDNSWILLISPDNATQLLIHNISSPQINITISPGAHFTGGTATVPPTAVDAVRVGDPSNYYIWLSGYTGGNYLTGAFYALQGTRDGDQTTRVIGFDSSGRMIIFLGIEHIITDLSDLEWAKNRVIVTASIGTAKAVIARNDYSFIARTFDGIKCILSDNMAFNGNQNTFLSVGVGTLDGVRRASPVWVGPLASPTAGSGFNNQTYGYIPDLYWTDSNYAANTYYTIGATWTQLYHILVPRIGTIAQLTGGGSRDARALSPSLPGGTLPETPDTTPPTFAGITGATATDDNTVALTWTAGSDAVTSAGNLVYEVHYSTTESDTFQVRGAFTGVETADITLLKPGTQYYFRVRCKDEAGNVDANVVELSATTTGAPDVAAPTITIESPTPGTAIQPTTTLVARITDDHGISAANIFIYYPNDPGLPWEVVYNSTGFEPIRYGTCTRTELVASTDYRYYIRRTGGWPSAPRLHVDPVDVGGNVI